MAYNGSLGNWFSGPGVENREACGIFIPKDGESSEVPVPLRRRDVTATIYTTGKVSDTCENLTYVSDVGCCAIFRFPLPPRSAVYRFRALIGDREIITKVKPRDEAREEYELAVQQGHSAVHLSQHAQGASVFEVSLGNLGAGEQVLVELRYLRLLDFFGTTLEWSHTATWVPPYIGSDGDIKAGLDKVAAELPVFAHKVSYSLSYDVKILADPGAVRTIESVQPVKVVPPADSSGAATGSVPTGQGGLCCWSVSLAADLADPSRDLTLTLEMDPAATGTSTLFLQRAPPSAEGGEARTFALVTFVPPPLPPPALLLPSLPPAEGAGGVCPQLQPQPPPLQQQQQLCKEIWFVLDCSGSMRGLPIQQARESALLSVRDLPLGSGVKFNVTCFGSNHKSLYDDCRPYSADTEREAVAWIQQNAPANMGGTEILAVLGHVYCSPLTPGYSREVIFLTDGGISGHEESLVYDIVTPPEQRTPASGAAAGEPSTEGGSPVACFGKRRPDPDGDRLQGLKSANAAEAARRTHVLCLGIGDGVHRGLLDGIARRSGGLAAYVVSDEAIAAKTAFLKKAATARGGASRPRLVTHGALVRPAPHVLPQRVFAGEPLQVLLEVVSCEADASLELVADCIGELQPQEAADAAVAAAGDAATAAAAPPPPPPQLRISLPLGPMVRGGAAPSTGDGEALGVLHAMSYIDSLLAGTSPLHFRPDGTALPTPPSDDLVRQTVVRLAVAANLVTPYTSAVGVSLRRDPADPAAAARQMEVPLQVPAGRTLWQQQNADTFDRRSRRGLRERSRSRLRCKVASAAGCAAVPPHISAGSTMGGFGAAPMRGFGAAPMSNFGAAPMGGLGAAPMSDFGAAPMSMPMSMPILFGARPSQVESLQLQVNTRLGNRPPEGSPSNWYGFGAAKAKVGAVPAQESSAAPAAPSNVFSLDLGAAAPIESYMYAAWGAPPTTPQTTTPSGFRSARCNFSLSPQTAPTPAHSSHALLGAPVSPCIGATPSAAAFAASDSAAPQDPGPAPSPCGALSGGELLAFLNLHRTTQGFWAAGPQLATALGLPLDVLLHSPQQAGEPPQPAPSTVAALRPVGLSDDAWATLVVLACLRTRLASQREVWADMQAKALAWLEARWPVGQGVRSVGSAVLALAKALEH